MKLISWNVNGIRACVKKRIHGLFEEINNELIYPDILDSDHCPVGINRNKLEIECI